MTAAPATDYSMAELRAIAARHSFEHFLRFVVLRSDDPKHPAPIQMRPYPYQLERARAWQGGASEIVLKARQVGFSSALLSPYSLYRAMCSGWNVGYWSLNEKTAIRHLETRVLYQHQHLPVELRDPVRRNDTLLEFPATGGSLQVFPATQVGGTGETFQLVEFDEASFHRYFGENWEQVQPAISAGGQAIVNSTANPQLGPSGPYYDAWQAAEAGESLLSPVFIPVFARPGRDEAWLERQRQLHMGDSASFDAQYPKTAAEAFVGRAGLVYPQFDPERHVIADPLPWAQCLYRYVGYDLGGGDPTAVVAIGLYRARDGFIKAHQYGESVWTQGAPDVEDMWAYMSDWHAKGPLTGVEADAVPGGQTVASTLRNLFEGRVTVSVETQGRGEGLGLVGAWLDRAWLTISPDCKHSIREFANYRWLERTDPNSHERYATKTPHDHHFDAGDARRRALVGAQRKLMMPSQGAQAYAEIVI